MSLVATRGFLGSLVATCGFGQASSTLQITLDPYSTVTISDTSAVDLDPYGTVETIG